VIGNNPVLNGILAGADLSYNISFAGGNGVLTWEDLVGDADHLVPNPRTTQTATKPVGGGPINIAPWNSVTHPGAPFYFPGDPLGTAPAPATGKCTAGFEVHGVLSGVLQS
jgi:hypothetical protein